MSQSQVSWRQESSVLVHADKQIVSFDISLASPLSSRLRPVQFAMHEADVESVLRCGHCKKPFEKGESY